MPITEKATIKSYCTFSKDRKHRFLLTIEWDEKKPKVVVIMKAPADANCIMMDLTTSLVVRNLYTLNYGGCDIVNLGSKLDYVKLVVDDKDVAYNKENKETILKCVANEKIKTVVIAWGSCGEGNTRIKRYEDSILKMLADYQEKLYVIEDERGKRGLHPLTPIIRNKWNLVQLEKIESNSPTPESKEAKKKNEPKAKTSKNEIAEVVEAEEIESEEDIEEESEELETEESIEEESEELEAEEDVAE